MKFNENNLHLCVKEVFAIKLIKINLRKCEILRNKLNQRVLIEQKIANFFILRCDFSPYKQYFLECTLIYTFLIIDNK